MSGSQWDASRKGGEEMKRGKEESQVESVGSFPFALLPRFTVEGDLTHSESEDDSSR